MRIYTQWTKLYAENERRGNDQKITQSARVSRYMFVGVRANAGVDVDAENTMIYGVCSPANNAGTLGLENLRSAFARMHRRQPRTIFARARERINVNGRDARGRGNYCSFFIAE